MKRRVNLSGDRHSLLNCRIINLVTDRDRCSPQNKEYLHQTQMVIIFDIMESEAVASEPRLVLKTRGH